MKSIWHLLEGDSPEEAITYRSRQCSCGGSDGDRIAQLLIERGADVTVVRESGGMSALKFASIECNAKTINALITGGADVDGPPDSDQTALRLAARENNVPAIELIVKHGADPSLVCGLRWARGKTHYGFGTWNLSSVMMAIAMVINAVALQYYDPPLL